MRGMKKAALIGIVFIVAALVIFGMNVSKTKEPIQKVHKPLVGVTTFALGDMVKHIAQGTVQIVHILPFGVEPHDFEPTPKLMGQIEKSALVIYNGAGLEPWIHTAAFKNSVVNMSKYVNLRKVASTKNLIDPHYWLDFENMKKATDVITKRLIALLPENEKLYKKNEKLYLQMLDSLDKKYSKALGTCQKDTIIVNHNAFSYLANKYNFHVAYLSGLSPDAQPNAKKIIELIGLIKEHNVSTLFFEDFASDKAIKSIANTAKVQVDVLKPLGNITADEAKANLSYEAMMLINLKKLSKALSCH